MALSVALQLYTVRNDMAADFEGTLARVKELGYEGVEFAGLFGRSAAEVKKMCEDAGLVPISAHVPYRDILKDPRGVLSIYAEIGCKYVALPYLIPEDRPGSENFIDVIKNARMIGEIARELGMTLLYHNHDFEFDKIDGKYALDVLYESVPADLLKTELDVCWVNVGGEDPVNYIGKYSGRAPVVHLKDFVGSRNENMYELIGIESEKKETTVKFEFRPVGYGVQNMPAIVKAAEGAGAQWVVVEQDQPSMELTPMQCAEKSREYLKSIGL